MTQKAAAAAESTAAMRKDNVNIYNQTATPDETPILIKNKLAEFESALDDVGDKEKRCYLMAKEKGPDECNDAHKLIFLRCEVFEVDRAVARFVKYWEARVAVFGEDKAFLPLAVDGALKDDMESIEVDYLQVANKTDPDGRAILLFDFNKEGEDLSSESLLRVVWYQAHVALTQESCQQRGVVLYVRCVDRFTDWRPSLSKKIAAAARGILPIRLAGIHFMQPPSYITLILAVVRPVMGKKLRNRFYHHSGSVDDLLKSLSKFGLGDMDMLPTMFGGELTSCL
mmetsp:Transcript_17903/g.30245  ORF Transcript_17903/g.30245 Transcript_17903/m.30245 type:complete len:284 (+) Transcript_17903:137-988(+)